MLKSMEVYIKICPLFLRSLLINIKVIELIRLYYNIERLKRNDSRYNVNITYIFKMGEAPRNFRKFLCNTMKTIEIL